MKKLLAGAIELMFLGSIFGCSGKVPSNLGVNNGRLAHCPDSPNCVSSQADQHDEKHYIGPLTYRGTKETALASIDRILASYPRVTVVEQRKDYIHAEFKSAIMGFVDDVEFYCPDKKMIHVRSASRLGYSDLGANRKRIERLRNLLNEQQQED